MVEYDAIIQPKDAHPELDKVGTGWYLALAQMTVARVMKIDGNLLAWIEPRSPVEFVGAFVGEAARDGHRLSPGRAPATRVCSSPHEARRWVEEQAAALDLPIEWVSGVPREE